ncbi:MAG: ABC transporter ATP-binding protein, partial [Isosphaeraceae bacterium]
KEYEGGYDDYLRQRPAEPMPASAPEPPKKKPAEAPRPQVRKLSFKERKELEALPGRIEELEAQIQTLHEALADPSFYKKDRGEIAQARTNLENIERELAAAYERWHVLEELEA